MFGVDRLGLDAGVGVIDTATAGRMIEQGMPVDAVNAITWALRRDLIYTTGCTAPAQTGMKMRQGACVKVL